MSKGLNPAKALIFRIVHRSNVPLILDNGLRCRNSEIVSPDYVSIGNQELIDKRALRLVPSPPGGTLSDYVPFYFTPFSPMLYNVKTGHGGIPRRANGEIVILVSSLHRLKERNIQFLFTDRHAYLQAAQFYTDVTELDQIDWPLLQRRDFKRDPDDPGKMERYQAEALVHRCVPLPALLGVACYDNSTASSLKTCLTERGLALSVVVKPTWYF